MLDKWIAVQSQCIHSKLPIDGIVNHFVFLLLTLLCYGKLIKRFYFPSIRRLKKSKVSVKNNNNKVLNDFFF